MEDEFTSEESMKRTVYLGDGAYMRVDGFQVVIWCQREEGKHYVAIEDYVLSGLGDILVQVRSDLTMTKRKEFTFLEAMDLINTGETMECCYGDRYRSHNGKLVYDESGDSTGHLDEEIKHPWFKVEKLKKEDIKVYIHLYKDAYFQQMMLTEITLLNWDEYIKINTMYEDDTLISSIILKNTEACEAF